MTTKLSERTRSWLKNDAFPLWSERGIDWEQGGFVENLSLKGERIDGPKRSMVQARQIYTYRVAIDLGVVDRDFAAKAVTHSADFLAKNAYLPSGAIAHQVDRAGRISHTMADLYAQAFGVFGMANAFRVAPKPEYRERAMNLVRYLDRERRVKAGGYTEVKDGGTQYQSNPHMHLFEAALSWLEIDPATPMWRALADEVFELCRTKFVDRETGLLAEHFDENWIPQKTDGKFMFEPGHQFEWSWLLKWYERLTRVSVASVADRFYKISEDHGIDRPSAYAIDEVWSDFTPKKKSARFWPQTERIKAAKRMGDQKAADEGLTVLFRYMEASAVPGLWYDNIDEAGAFHAQPANSVKASSLYHIVGAMNEYLSVP